MFKLRSSERLARVTLTILIVLGLAFGQAVAVQADDKLGQSAIDSAMDQFDTDPVEEPSEPPPADGSGAAEPAAEETSEEPASDAPTDEAEPAEAGDESATSGEGTSGEAAAATDDESVASAEPSQTEQAAAASNDNPANTETISATQAATDSPAPGAGNDAARSGGNRTETLSLAQVAASNVLSGGAPLGETAPVAAAPAAAPVSGGLQTETAQQATNLRAAGQSLRPSTIAPRQNRDERAGDDSDDNGTVVVNSLSDAGDQGKLAVHSNLVAGTLCDGSQFWSLDGGGTINANGVNLSANGGTSLSAAGGGDDNGAAGGAAGNGGSAHSSADGGIVVVDELVTGNNRGNEVTVGDQSFTGNCGSGVIDGGDSTTVTNVNISADGGTAIADATGGDNNFASGEGAGAGNGGRANASADGGIVIVGSLILGNNEGNQISTGGSGSGGAAGTGSGSGSGGCLGGSIDGGNVLNETNIDISADGGIAIADATGGDDNIALGDDANSGNGGRARANADGGLILAGDIVTGNNQGNSISVECGGSGAGDGHTGVGGRVVVNGGTVLNQTNLSLNADGGTAIADASGGDDNIAGGPGSGDAAAGNGGRAESDASGGVIRVGNIVSGNNVGNVIALGANFAPVPSPDRDDKKPERQRKISAPSGKPAAASSKPSTASKRAPAGRTASTVGVLPNTGTGSTATVGGVQWVVFPLGGMAAFDARLAERP